MLYSLAMLVFRPHCYALLLQMPDREGCNENNWDQQNEHDCAYDTFHSANWYTRQLITVFTSL